VAGGQDDATKGLPFADHGAGCRGGQNAVTTDQHAAKTGRCRHAQDGLDGDIVVIAAIATEDQRLPLLAAQRVENGLDEILEIPRLLKYRHFLSQPGCPRLLAGERRAGNADHLHSHVMPRRKLNAPNRYRSKIGSCQMLPGERQQPLRRCIECFASGSSIAGRMLLATALPSSTPHWSKELSPQMSALHEHLVLVKCHQAPSVCGSSRDKQQRGRRLIAGKHLVRQEFRERSPRHRALSSLRASSSVLPNASAALCAKQLASKRLLMTGQG
jgi:hypothetical protein